MVRNQFPQRKEKKTCGRSALPTPSPHGRTLTKAPLYWSLVSACNCPEQRTLGGGNTDRRGELYLEKLQRDGDTVFQRAPDFYLQTDFQIKDIFSKYKWFKLTMRKERRKYFVVVAKRAISFIASSIYIHNKGFLSLVSPYNCPQEHNGKKTIGGGGFSSQ